MNQYPQHHHLFEQQQQQQPYGQQQQYEHPHLHRLQDAIGGFAMPSANN